MYRSLETIQENVYWHRLGGDVKFGNSHNCIFITQISGLRQVHFYCLLRSILHTYKFYCKVYEDVWQLHVTIP